MTALVVAIRLACALPLAMSGDPLGSYRDLPVLSVDVEAPTEDEVAELRALIEIDPGYLLTGSDVAAAVKRIYALGRFSTVRVYAERVSGAVALRFYARPIRTLGDLEILGLRHTKSSELTAALQLRPRDEVDRRTAERLRTRALNHLKTIGFPDARIEIHELADPVRRTVSFVLEVDEGRAQRVSAVHFAGDTRVPAAYLQALLRLRVGTVLDRRALVGDRAALLRAYRQRGFQRARVGDPTVTADENGAIVTYLIDAGPRIDVAFVGNHLLTRAQLAELSPQTGEPLRDGDLRIWAGRIEDAYQRLGYADATVEVHGYSDPETGVLHYALRIEEGEPVWVARVQFTGAKAVDDDLMRAQIEARLREGLAATNLLRRLGGSDAAAVWGGHAADATPQLAAERALSPVPPEQRWVPGIYEQALDEITQVYRGLGYLRARVGPPRPSRAGQQVQLVIPVDEGVRTFVDSIELADNEAFTADELLQALASSPAQRRPAHAVELGGPFSYAALEESRIALVRRYRDEGYLYARVFAQSELSADRTRAGVRYRVEEGPQVHVQRVLIKGNRYTREGIIRPRIGFADGDVYRLEEALEAQRDIAALGVFASVRVKLLDEEQPSERKDLVAEVVERDRQPVELAWGISTADGPRLQLSYAHLNVAGLALTFATSAKVNRQVFFALYGPYADILRRRYDDFGLAQQVERELRASLRSPRALTLPFDPSLRLDLLNEHDNALPYSLTTTAAIVGLDLRLTDRVVLVLEPQVSLTELVCASLTDGSGSNCENEVQAVRRQRTLIQQGTQRTAKISPSITWDRRDSPFNPRRGWLARVRTAYAVGVSKTPTAALTTDPCAADIVSPTSSGESQRPFTFVKAEALVTGYVPVSKAVLAVSAQAGVLRLLDGAVVPVDERFYLGGRDTLRGYVERSLIAQDACVVPAGAGCNVPPWCHEAIRVTGADATPVSQGGDIMALVKTELRLPVANNLSFALFLDAGNLWAIAPQATELTLRVGTGVGLRYATPVGSLSLDLGVNPDRRAINAEPVTQLHFSVGSF